MQYFQHLVVGGFGGFFCNSEMVQNTPVTYSIAYMQGCIVCPVAYIINVACSQSPLHPEKSYGF